MPAPSPRVNRDELARIVREIVADVLMTDRDAVSPASALVADLGAESIDFLDLLFRLEDALGRRMPAARWQEFVRERLAGQDLSRAITVASVVEFVEHQLAS